jgi:bifunctional oligoribonuclease and PAP phosphatase NrnA
VIEPDTLLCQGKVDDAAEIIRQSHIIAIFSHVNPDGDSVGVGLGLWRGLRSLGYDAVFAISDPVPEVLRYLPDVETIQFAVPQKQYDLLLVADCGDVERVGRLYEENRSLFESTPILNLDHHDSNTCFGTANLVDHTAASSSEIAFRLLERLGARIDSQTATDLLTGIINDTGSFQHSNTDGRVLHIASELRNRGGDLERAAFEMFRAKPFSTAKLWGIILSTLEMDQERGIVWAYMSPTMAEQAGSRSDESEGVVDYMSGIQGATIAAFLKERDPGIVRVSLRSHGFDVGQICRAFGGGGHIQAAGCTINATLPEARRRITEVYDELCTALPAGS